MIFLEFIEKSVCLQYNIWTQDLCFISFNARKNGAVVGAVFKDVKGPLFPTVAVHSQHEVYVVLSLLSIP